MLEVGDRVIVMSDCQSRGKTGKIESFYGSKYNIDDKSHAVVILDKSKKEIGYNVRSLEKIGYEIGENIMSEKFKDCVNYVGVKFLTGYNTSQEYTFANYDASIEVGDFVVVDSAGSFNVTKVSKVYDDCDKVSASKEVVCKVDMSDFALRKENREKKAELKQKMDKKVKELQSIAIYKLLAKEDPELAEMLESFESIK